MKMCNGVCVSQHRRPISSFPFYRASYANTVLAVIVCLSVPPSVCLSVCQSDTSQSCTKMAKPRITLTTPYDRPGTLVFRCQKSRRNSNDIIPNGAPNRGGVGSHRRFFTSISLYLRNGARQGHSKANSNSCAFYRMALFSMTLGEPKPPHFQHFAVPHISVTGEDRHFKFGGQVYHRMSQPVGDKPSLKGAWSGSRGQHYNFTPHEIPSAKVTDFKFSAQFGHEK